MRCLRSDLDCEVVGKTLGVEEGAREVVVVVVEAAGVLAAVVGPTESAAAAKGAAAVFAPFRVDACENGKILGGEEGAREVVVVVEAAGVVAAVVGPIESVAAAGGAAAVFALFIGVELEETNRDCEIGVEACENREILDEAEGAIAKYAW